MTAGTTRLVEVPPERLARWVAGFGERHGEVDVVVRPGAVLLTGADGATAELEVPWPQAAPSLEADPVTALAAHAGASRTALIVLVRRGGYAAGLARDGRLLDSAVGTRYVQGRTAAGGWSQQRYARRRSGQAAALEVDAVDAVLRVLGRAAVPPEVVVPGGDRLLVTGVLEHPRLRDVSGLPRGPLLDVGDPRRAVLEDAAGRAPAVRVRIGVEPKN